jgi:hypothetical protein
MVRRHCAKRGDERLGVGAAEALLGHLEARTAFEQVTGIDLISLAIGSDYRVEFVAAGVRFGRYPGGRVDWTIRSQFR